jgi:hypothetical protein
MIHVTTRIQNKTKHMRLLFFLYPALINAFILHRAMRCEQQQRRPAAIDHGFGLWLRSGGAGNSRSTRSALFRNDDHGFGLWLHGGANDTNGAGNSSVRVIV